VRKFSVDQAPQMLGDRRVVESLDDFIQEAGDDETLRGLWRDPARTQINISSSLI